MLADQQGLCANPNCQNGPPAGRRLYVDHDHGHCPGKRSCGNCIRGLLCPSCNFALGNVSDDAERLRGLADYLESYVGSESTAGIC
jgi:hypothetical protein